MLEGLPTRRGELTLLFAFFVASLYAIKNGYLTVLVTRGDMMIRLSRAEREQAILDALKRLKSKGEHTAFTKGEICKSMGITSQSKIRDILRDMARRGMIDSGLWRSDVYGHDVEIFSLRATKQIELSSHLININGVLCDMVTGEAVEEYA
jgi:hypothetical protein